MNAQVAMTSTVTARPSVAAAAPLSILQVRSSIGLYGADRMALALNRALARNDVRSRLLSINNYRMREQALNGEAQALGEDAALLPCRSRFDLGTARALVREIDDRKAVVLHTHDYKSAFYACLASRNRRACLVATLHGWVDGAAPLRLYNHLERVLLRRFDALVVVAERQIEPLLRAGIAPARIHQIDNGIDVPRVPVVANPALRRELGLHEASFVLGAVARLSPEKNLPMLIEAFAPIAARDRGVALAIAGDGPQRAELEALVARLQLGGRVRLLGVRADMERIYPLFDCLVLPSLREGMPLVVLEAMAHALPVIASSVGDVPRLLANSTYGRCVPPGDQDALREAMRAAVGASGRRDVTARQHVLSRHSAAAMADRYLDIYRSLQDPG